MTAAKLLTFGPMTSWKPPSRYSRIPARRFERLRRLKGIILEYGIPLDDGKNITDPLQMPPIPPPAPKFEEMRLPRIILDYLHRVKSIQDPTPIQMQGIPIAFSGRDMLGIASTGSGKSLVFLFAALQYVWEAEARMPLIDGEGPLSMIMVPSRELAKQAADTLVDICEHCREEMPPIRIMLAIGGMSVKETLETPYNHASQRNNSAKNTASRFNMTSKGGWHILVGTPGRIHDMLTRKMIHLKQCRQVILDEADRLINDAAFESELTQILAHCRLTKSSAAAASVQSNLTSASNNNNLSTHYRPHQQFLLFSATMPKSIIRSFIRQHLTPTPFIVNVGRAGAASMDVAQEFEWIASTKILLQQQGDNKDESKDDSLSSGIRGVSFLYDRKQVHKVKLAVLLKKVLPKTAPPVMLFASSQADVDDITEALLEAGVKAAAIHGGLSQEERSYALEAFKAGKKDFLVATDVAGKGLDFSTRPLKHVINWSMPTSIEDYVHRIGRTGRGGRTGISTTLLTPPLRDDPAERVLLRDLVQLLREAKQRIPPFLSPYDIRARKANHNNALEGCVVCGGLGHAQDTCPKVDLMAYKQQSRMTGRADLPF